MERLDVCLSDRTPVGQISFEPLSGKFQFVYCDTWLSARDRFPLTPSISFSAEHDNSLSVKRYLENLLPEGAGLDVVAQTNRLSKSNVFGLIRAIGQESAGAILILPEGGELLAPAELREVSQSELSERIRARDTLPFSVWDGKVRLSIAGFQDKIAVFIRGEAMFLASHPFASTHILKPVPKNPAIASLVANEHFCMSLANRVGIPAAKTTILRVPEAVLVVERFDRVAHPDKVARHHVIDACQLLDLPPTHKYERNFGSGRDVAHIKDGASLKSIYAMDRLAESPVAFRLQMLRWTLFQYLIGNADAHGKNLSFYMRSRGKIVLSPAYDLVSTVTYNGIEDELAMGIGDAFQLKEIGAFQWACFAEECRIPKRLLSNEMKKMAALVAKHSAATDLTQFTAEERADVMRIQNYIECQSGILMKDAALVVDVMTDSDH